MARKENGGKNTHFSRGVAPWLSTYVDYIQQFWTFLTPWLSTVNQGFFSCNYQAVNCKQVFLYSNSTVQTLKSTVSENSLMFLSWNHFPTKTTKCSLHFKNPLSTDLKTNLEIHVGSFWYSPNLLVHKIDDRDVINSQYL